VAAGCNKIAPLIGLTRSSLPQYARERARLIAHRSTPDLHPVCRPVALEASAGRLTHGKGTPCSTTRGRPDPDTARKRPRRPLGVRRGQVTDALGASVLTPYRRRIVPAVRWVTGVAFASCYDARPQQRPRAELGPIGPGPHQAPQVRSQPSSTDRPQAEPVNPLPGTGQFRGSPQLPRVCVSRRAQRRWNQSIR
jgi:hypothetical protein